MIASGANRRGFALGIVLSLVIHGVAGGILRASTSDGDGAGSDNPILLTDIDVPPEPPEAHDPVEEEAPRPVVDLSPQPEPEPEPAATIEPLPEPEPEPDEIAMQPIDAGVEEDATEIAEVTPDAGVGADAGEELAATAQDAGLGESDVARADGDAGSDTAEMVASGDLDAGTGAGDGGVRVAGAVAGMDAGAAVASDTPRGPVPSWVDGTASIARETGQGEEGAATGPAAPPGAGSNLLAYFPQGEVVTLLVRLDRFRGTQWAQRMEAVVRPMPDYQAIIGNRNVLFSDLFDVLVISSPRPQDVAATTLVGRYGGPDAKIRRFLSHAQARVAWRSVRGGAVGRRLRSPLVLAHDRRVFLIPYPGMVMLTPPKYLGPLLAPSRTPVGAARADEAETPEWIKRVRAIEVESGVDAGPAVLLTMVGFPQRFEIPLIGTVPGPDRATLAAEITTGGFLVRGNLLFSTEARAAEFVSFATAKQKWLVDTVRGRLLLAPFHAFNAVKGLSLKRRGNKVAYASSISVADGRAMLDYAAQWTSVFFPSLLPAPDAPDRAGKGAGDRKPSRGPEPRPEGAAKPVPGGGR